MVALPLPNSPTLDAIYRAYELANDGRESIRLGMSKFGTECDRALWYDFRWASVPEAFSGRTLRLFKTGHREEDRMIADLRSAGIVVLDRDPATGGQWVLLGVKGHLKGMLDGRAICVPEAPKTEHVLECKTHNDKSFKALVTQGLLKSKPGHYAQVQLYMHYAGLTRALYLAHNKNTDELFVDRIAYDPVAAGQLVARASRIIDASVPPPKLHENPTSKAAFACGWCNHYAICHAGVFARRNCRTCAHVTPVDGGGWHCRVHDCLMDEPAQRAGCSKHLFIPEVVPFRQVDVNDDCTAVTYEKPDGTKWIDGSDTSEVGFLSVGRGGPRTDDNGTGDAVTSGASQEELRHAVKSSGPATNLEGVQ